mmetsp:Transcript_31745/g.66774  ORF Transcript_31745/g.66774 Transcript_31745/m.66774 type:complete len:123 (+) Transcript_31745:181-549(+)
MWCLPFLSIHMYNRWIISMALVALEAPIHRLLINIREQPMLVPHQVIIAAEIGIYRRRAVGVRYLLRHLDGLGLRGGTTIASGDAPWVGSQEEWRKEQSGGRWYSCHGNDGDESCKKMIHFR